MNCMIRTRKMFCVAEPVGRVHRGRQHSRSRRLLALDSGEWLVANSLKTRLAHRVVLLVDDRVAAALDQHLRIDQAGQRDRRCPSSFSA